jgi:DNA-binding NtrC family response regulator
MKNSTCFLFVDDDADDRKLFIEAVKEIDQTIVCKTANNGEQALAVLRDSQNSLPDLIFLDIRMPRINGKKCLVEIKKDESLKHIPVIIYTTSKAVEESKELRDLGAFYFISKPTNADEIYYLISFVMDEQAKVLRSNKLF